MIILDLDEMVEEKAKIKVNGEFHEIKEATIYDWAKYSNEATKVDKIEDKLKKDEASSELNWLLIEMLIPTLDYKKLEVAELVAVVVIVQKVFKEGASSFGKKMKTLKDVTKIERNPEV